MWELEKYLILIFTALEVGHQISPMEVCALLVLPYFVIMLLFLFKVCTLYAYDH